MLAAVVVVVVFAYYMWQNNWSLPTSFGGAQYQAVFLSNGQVYFGKASNLNGNYLNLRDVYYLRVSQVLQPVQGQKDPQPTQSVSLAKLGTAELHKPKDKMMINRDHVLFVEDLDDDSQVIEAITRYQEELAGTTETE